MTTLVATAQGIAADTKCGAGHVDKVLSGSGIVVGFVGDAYYGTKLAAWVLDGMRGGPPPWEESYKLDDDDRAADTSLVIVRKDGVFSMDGRGVLLRERGLYLAAGSGEDHALGAMEAYLECGWTLEEAAVGAVQQAIKFEKDTGGDAVWYPRGEPKRGRR